MFKSLRFRLLASYLVVLLVTLGVMSAVLIVILNTRTAPPQASYQRLAALAMGVNWRQVLNQQGLMARPLQYLEAVAADMETIATQQNVRILIMSLDDEQVFLDTAASYERGSHLDVSVENTQIASPYNRSILLEAVSGSFADPDNSAWLFVGLTPVRLNTQSIAVLFAEPRPQQTLQDALEDFGTSLLPLVLQAALAGIVIAVVLALLISRSIARPLQTVAQAAAAVAEGHYDQRIPISGPAEVQAVAEAFNQMSAKVQAEQKSQQDFLANVSHDLKTPLTSIQGYSQAIIDGAARDPKGAAHIIYEEAARLNRMVIELTDLARLQAGRLSMHMTPIDMGKLATAIGQRLAIVAQEKGVRLRVEASPMPEIAGDGDRLVQVLTNLISNAINYTPAGGEVVVRTCVIEGGVEVSVQDTGVGIAPAELPRIFERFYQVDKARGPRRGTGLGLAIVQEIVQAHGGKIAASSLGINRGSTFTVWLPSPNLTTIVRRR
jgi:two-component system, OmpR family, sensor kinase